MGEQPRRVRMVRRGRMAPVRSERWLGFLSSQASQLLRIACAVAEVLATAGKANYSTSRRDGERRLARLVQILKSNRQTNLFTADDV